MENKIIKERIITIDKEEFNYKDFVVDSRPCGFKKNIKYSIDDLPILPKQQHNFINFNSTIEQNNGMTFPEEISKGVNKYIKLIENFRNTKNPNLSIEKAINRELKKKKPKINQCKIIKKKTNVSFK